MAVLGLVACLNRELANKTKPAEKKGEVQESAVALSICVIRGETCSLGTAEPKLSGHV